jgi:2-succinyl-6-hydroxy-2,4-cyclohexadiene-1-carboxylate synthase
VTRLVLVPGFTQTASSWDGVVEALHPSIDVQVVEVPVRKTFVDTARAIGDEGGAAVYCGYSMGGRLCLRLALDRPALVRHLVVVSATPGIEDDGHRTERVASDERWVRSIEDEGIDAFLDRWLAQPLFDGVPASAPGVADRRALTSEYLVHCLRVLGTGAMEPMWSRLGELAMPVTVVTGVRDAKFTEIGARIPGQHIAVAGAGHAVALEAPDALAAVLNAVCG